MRAGRRHPRLQPAAWLAAIAATATVALAAAGGAAGPPAPSGTDTPLARWRRLERPPLPQEGTGAWARCRIDVFTLAAMAKHGLRPSREAGRRTWLRRVTFDLTGLPPERDEVEAFLADRSPDARDRVVDRLLASPRRGEHRARLWLDMARYTDSTASWLRSTAQAWRYRDWVIDALNRDLPYDRFVRLQLAADQIDAGDGNIAPGDLAALGFLGLSPTYWKELRLSPRVIRKVVAEEYDERIDTVSRTFLGLTVACARCHDHKYDPVTMEDYYALAGVFASTRLTDLPLLPRAERRRVLEARRRVAEIEARIKKLVSGARPGGAKKVPELRRAIERIKRETPHFDAPNVNAVADASLRVEPDGPDRTRLVWREGEPRDLPVYERGDPGRPGPIVARRFLAALSSTAPRPFRRGSGRLELAEAIVGESRGLTARVIANRIWDHLFGRGLVATTSNFGERGDPPSHPALLEDLAAGFVEHGWSLQRLERAIVLSATYGQASARDPDRHRIDPENRWLWRMRPRRLPFEAWRDAMLAISGELDGRIGGPSSDLADPGQTRRTIYGTVRRRALENMLRLHDFPDPTAHSPRRQQTTTPLQQLFLLNSEFIHRRSLALARRILAEPGLDDAARIERGHELLFARPPARPETELVLAFLENELARLPATTAGRLEAWRRSMQALLGTSALAFID